MYYNLQKKINSNFGIVPSSANPNYGYIKTGQKFGNGFKIDRFIEKPNKTIAKYIKSPKYLWNSGMVACKQSIFLSEMEDIAPKYIRSANEWFKI